VEILAELLPEFGAVGFLARRPSFSLVLERKGLSLLEGREITTLQFSNGSLTV